jgi:hypothetical protein
MNTHTRIAYLPPRPRSLLLLNRITLLALLRVIRHLHVIIVLLIRCLEQVVSDDGE